MLQWMGGSRRKVTNSRKSTQKRQKQYFEQRKRQQQHQTAGLESYPDGITTCSQHDRKHRSLDILSLLNLSTVAQECKSSCPNGENLDVNASTVNYHIPKCPPTILTNKVTPAEPVENKEARTPSGCQVVTLSSKGHTNAFNGNGDKADHWKTATKHQLSVLDLLGDDGPNGNSEGIPVHEVHVAFSVEGLGKVGTETPVHSPQQPGRIFSYGCSSPLKAARRPHSSKNLNYELDDLELEVDAMMQDINVQLSSSSLEIPIYSRGIMDSFITPKQKLFTVKDCRQLDGNGSKIKSLFSDEGIFCDIEDKNKNIWNARSSFLDDNFLDEREYDISCKNWPCQTDSDFADFLNFGDHEMSDFAFEGSHLLKKRNAEKATERFNILGSPATFSKHQTSERDYDFTTTDGARYPTIGRNCDFRDVRNQPAWSYFVTEDARDSLSLLSEESCSSSAVRGKATSNSPPSPVARQSMRRHGNDLSSPVKKYGVKNIYAKGTRYKNSDNIRRGENVNGSGKFTRMSSSSRLKPMHYSKLGPQDSRPFEVNSGFSSFWRTSETKSTSSGCKLQTEDSFGAFPVPELHINTNSPDVPVECSPSGSFFSEKHAFCQPFSKAHSYDSPIFSNIRTGRSRPDLSPDSEIECIPPDSSHVVGTRGNREFPDISVQESEGEDGENKSEIQLTDCGKFELEKEICVGNISLSSEIRKQMDASDSKDNSSECKEAKDETPELIESLQATYSPEHAEEISSSVKNPDKFESSIDEKEYDHDGQIPLPCQNGRKETEDTGPEEREIIRKEQTNCVDTSHQVMMLESYVLQLLSVQKVPKDASAQDTGKKV